MSGLFDGTSGTSYKRLAVVQEFTDHELAAGFAEMGEIAAAHWATAGPNDLLFVPIVYNYRHALELILKVAIRRAARCLRLEGATDSIVQRDENESWLANSKGGGHSLGALAARLEELLRRLKTESLPASTREVLDSLHQLDPKGGTFKYEHVRRGKKLEKAPRPGLDPKVPEREFQAPVDVAAMVDQFRRAFNLISDGMITQLDEIAQFHQEMADQTGWNEI